ncbi:MAG: hypothetical protein ABJH68_21350 [Ilumatobacter sp.]|uniref:hypothetical protein n=1 Tax=Ilumatobacter sp. TaxID=1967498 RepID=UPI003296A53E
MFVIVIVGVAIVVAAAGIALLVRPKNDPVDSFRRQIDALSPEARRPTIDQVRDAADDSGDNEPDDS